MSDETSTERRITGVAITDLGQHLIDLGQLLIDTGEHTGVTLRARIAAANEIGEPEVFERLDAEADSAIRRTLMGLNTFRRDYNEWERLIVEFALRTGLTQRDVATMLGVGLSTVNRWAQHPLTYAEN